MPKRKATESSNISLESTHALTDNPISFTTRNPTWAFLHLELVSNPAPTSSTQPLDPLTARTHLTSALSQLLGLTGTSIPIDILKIESEQGNKPSSLWIRVPHADATAVVAALSSWVGGSNEGGEVAWRVKQKGGWLGSIAAGSGREMHAFHHCL